MISSKNFLVIVLTISFAILFFTNSCRTQNTCPPKPAIGNVGQVINNKLDNIKPSVFKDTLFFTNYKKPKKRQKAVSNIYKSTIKNGRFLTPTIDKALPLNNYLVTSAPSFYFDEQNKTTELYFAALSPKKKSNNNEIYVAKMRAGIWDTPKILKFNISTEYFEDAPAISPNGKYLIFVSSRNDGIGLTDLYISKREENGSWSSPKNLGENINSKARETTPFISADGTLYFSSKDNLENTNFSIKKAESVGFAKWELAKPLLFPINSFGNDINPTIWNNNLILTSDRNGGCGAYDIFSFDLCGPVLLDVQISAEILKISFKGKAELIDVSKDTKIFINVNDDGHFNIPLATNTDYLLKYTNPCFPDYIPDAFIHSPCSNSSTVKLSLKMEIPSGTEYFSFAKYKVPFFVTGYYMPNTKENIESLRLKFSYNLLGTSDSTKYIQNPGEEYDNYAPIVDNAIDEAVDFIKEKFDFFEGDCDNSETYLQINIVGYSDPRAISKNGKYAGDDINEEESNFKVKRGEMMTNDLLSKLRAYYTSKVFQQKLEQDEQYQNIKDRIHWTVEGKGINPNNENVELMRIIEMSVSLSSE